MKKTLVCGVISLGVSLSSLTTASAGPIEDANYIADATFSEEYLGAIMDAMANLMASSITGELARSGITLSVDASQTLVALMMPTLIEGMKDGMRDEIAGVYLDNVSPESLAAYRAFLESAAGVELINSMPEIATVSSQVGERLGHDLGLEAAAEMIQRIQSGDFPAGTSKATRDELVALFDQQ
nr:DUF2059 domain-containing protein [Hyphomonas sp. Mor2]